MNFLKRMGKHGVIFARKRRDHIHVDVVKTDASGQLIRFHSLLCRMRATDADKRFVVHRLRIDADPRYGMIVKHTELLRIQRIRPPGLNGKLFQQAEVLFNMRKQSFKLRRCQAAGRSAADITHADMQSHLARHLGTGFNLMQKRV